MPRYIFPCVEAMAVTDGGLCWHNRGLNSLPLAKTWLPWDEVPIGDLRLSCYSQDLPEPDAEELDKSEKEGEPDTQSSPWRPELVLTEVDAAISALLNVIADSPDELGEGFQYLIVPLQGSPSLTEALRPGRRVRLFLSDADATPTSLDPEERESWVWSRGECDLSVWAVPAAGESEYLPDVYRPLYCQ